jgi:hypothetical protein
MLSGANGRIEKAGSRFIRILLSRQYVTKEKSKAREKETSGPVNGQLSFWRHNSQMFSTYSDMSLRKVDSDDGSDGHVETARNRSTQ